MKNLITILFLVLSVITVPALEALNVDKNVEIVNVSITHDVFFNTNQHSLSTEEYQKLLNFIIDAQDVDIERISIIGFCDDRGSLEYNSKLSIKRANTVKDLFTVLRNDGKNPKILNVNGKGEIQVTASKKILLDNLRALNRKVTIVIASEKTQKAPKLFDAENLKTGDVINLKDLKFEKGLRYLTTESEDFLKEITAFFLEHKEIYFTVNGHVCCTEYGRDSRDKDTGIRNLSVVRAKYIRDYLVEHGVSSERIQYKGLKGMYNLGGDPSEDRRVEFVIN